MKKLVALLSGETERPIHKGQPVVLQMEVCTRREAVMLQILLWVMVVLMIGVAVVFLTLRSVLYEDYNSEDGAAYFDAVLAIASFCLFILFTTSLIFAWRLRRELRRGLKWSRHQIALVVEAVVHLTIQLLMTIFWLAPYGVVVSKPCELPAVVVSVFAQLRWSAMSLLLLWLSIMAHSMTCHSHGNRLHRYIKAIMVWLFPSVFGSSNAANEPRLQTSLRHQNAKQSGANDGSNSGVDSFFPGGPNNLQQQQSQADRHKSIELQGAQPDDSHHRDKAIHPQADACQEDSAQTAAATAESCQPLEELEQQPFGAVEKHVRFQDNEEIKQQPQQATHTGKENGYGAKGATSGGSHSDHQNEPPRQLIVDLPIKDQFLIHIPKMLLWMGLEGGVIFGFVQTWSPDRVNRVIIESCQDVPCTPETREIVAMSMETAVLFMYLAVFFFYQRRAFRDHRNLPYNQYRITSMAIRVQARSIAVVLFATFIDHAILIVAGITSCWTYIQSHLGLPPVQFSLAIVALVSAYLYLPASQIGAPSLETFFHEFSWSQASFEEAKQLRDQHLLDYLETQPTMQDSVLKMLPGKAITVEYSAANAIEQLKNEPMFCMELSVRLFYWSRLAYLHGEKNARAREEVALKLFSLQNFELLYEEDSELKVLMGWGGPGEIVVSFRGTVTTKNIITDLKFLRTWHGKDKRWCGTQPIMVHAGFWEAWTQNDFNVRLLNRLEEIVEASHYSPENFKFYITGHSLGGALAILAAFDIKKLFPKSPMTVYTFGAPRVGSKGFASEYNKLIPDTWTIVNDEDPIPRIPKYVYKRTGQRVSIDEEGDIIVRPSYFELSVLTKSGGSVRHHWLRTYSLALGAIFKAQFIPGKALPGGADGVREIAATLDIGEALMLQNMDVASLQDGKILPERLSTFYHAESQKEAAEGSLLSRCWGSTQNQCSLESLTSCFTAPPRSVCSDKDDYQVGVATPRDSLDEEVEEDGFHGADDADGDTKRVLSTQQLAAVGESTGLRSSAATQAKQLASAVMPL